MATRLSWALYTATNFSTPVPRGPPWGAQSSSLSLHSLQLLEGLEPPFLLTSSYMDNLSP